MKDASLSSSGGSDGVVDKGKELREKAAAPVLKAKESAMSFGRGASSWLKQRVASVAQVTQVGGGIGSG